MKLKETYISIDDLYLDDSNPRIPANELSQESLIQDLCKNEDVFSRIESILRNGFFQFEKLITVKENGRYVVIEGNRRLAACKLIIDPTIAGPKLSNDIKRKFALRIANFDIESIKKIPCAIAKSREEAAPYLFNKHGVVDIRKWAPIQKGRFCKQQLSSGADAAYIEQQYAVKKPELSRLISLVYFYDVAMSLDYSDDLSQEEVEKIHDSRNFAITILERICCSKIGQEFLGISIDSFGAVEGHIEEAEFKKGIKKIVCDIVKGKINSRTLNKKDAIEKYLGDFTHHKPDTSTTGSFGSGLILPPKSSEVPTVAPQAQRRRKKVLPKNKMWVGVNCTIEQTRIVQIYHELTRLQYKKYPNAFAVLFRSFVEMTVSHFLRINGEIDKMKLAYKNNKGKKPHKFWPSLDEMLTHIINEDLISDPKVKSALQKFKSTHREFLNLSVHNEASWPSAQVLWDIYCNLEELLKVLLK